MSATTTLINQRGIYIITNTINGKKYIGKSVDIRNRIGQYRYNQKNRVIEHAIAKYGIQNFKFEAIYYPETNNDDLLRIESDFIKHFNTLAPNGYNVTGYSSDRTGVKHSEVTINKMKGKKHTELTKSKISETKKNNRNTAWNKGISMSDEIKLKISKSKIGKKMGGDNPFSKRICRYDLDMNFIDVFDSTIEASRTSGIGRSSITNNLNNRSKSAGGYIWKFFDTIPLIENNNACMSATDIQI